MNCLYCNNPCDGPDYDASCFPCQAYYAKQYHLLKCQINDKNYVVIFRKYESKKGPSSILELTTANPIVHFAQTPNITPKNIREKILTYLIFS